MNLRADVVVCGGGPAAFMACMQLLNAGASVVQVVRQADLRAPRPTEVIPPRALLHLQLAGVSLHWLGSVACRGLLSRWGDTKDFLDYDLFYGLAATATDRSTFHAQLRDVAGKAGVRFIDVERFAHMSYDKSTGWTCHMHTREGICSVRCRWILEASGRMGASLAAKALKKVFVDRLLAITIPVARGAVHADALIVESTDNGWWYAPPPIRDSEHIVFLTDADLLPTSVYERCKWLAREFDLAEVTQQATAATPMFNTHVRSDARFGFRRECTLPGLIVIGDSALCLDPLSGSGVSAALESARMASEHVLTNATCSIAQRYSAWQRDELFRHSALRGATYARGRPLHSRSPFWARRCSVNESCIA